MIPYPIRKMYNISENSVVDVVFNDENTPKLNNLYLHIKMFKASDKLNVPCEVIQHIFIEKNNNIFFSNNHVGFIRVNGCLIEYNIICDDNGLLSPSTVINVVSDDKNIKLKVIQNKILRDIDLKKIGIGV